MRTVLPGADAGGRLIEKTFWAHLAVAAAACALTLSIVGSLAFFGVRYLRDLNDREKILLFVGSLEHRTPEDLAEVAQQLQRRPGVARRVLPAVLASVSRTESARRQLAAIRLCRVFVDDPRVERALFQLRHSPSDLVAGQAVDALRDIRPPQRAAEKLVQCLDAASPAVVDVVCVGLLDLGEQGVAALAEVTSRLSLERRIWLSGLIAEHAPTGAIDVTAHLLQDDEVRVRRAATEAACRAEGISTLRLLAARLNDTDDTIRRHAAVCLGRLTGRGFEPTDDGVAQAREWAREQGV
jgi:HEAT repeat protein